MARTDAGVVGSSIVEAGRISAAPVVGIGFLDRVLLPEAHGADLVGPNGRVFAQGEVATAGTGPARHGPEHSAGGGSAAYTPPGGVWAGALAARASLTWSSDAGSLPADQGAAARTEHSLRVEDGPTKRGDAGVQLGHKGVPSSREKIRFPPRSVRENRPILDSARYAHLQADADRSELEPGAGPGPPAQPARHQAAVPGPGQAAPGREDPQPGPACPRVVKRVRCCPECGRPSAQLARMPGGLDQYHAVCWEAARLRRAPLLAAARRQTEASLELARYLVALRRDPDLPRLSPDGLVAMGSAILDRSESTQDDADNSPLGAHSRASEFRRSAPGPAGRPARAGRPRAAAPRRRSHGAAAPGRRRPDPDPRSPGRPCAAPSRRSA